MSKGNYLIVLKNINIEKVNIKYGINVYNTIENDLDNPKSTTKLSELNIERGTPIVVSFLDESKRSHVCNISMIDFKSKMNINLLRYHCFWCKNPFDTKPIGCPVNYVSSQVIKKYHSHISKDTYTIKENVTFNRKANLINDDTIILNIGEYYETDGVFCSFNCCKAYIIDNKNIRLYDKSDMLLTKMYNEMMGTKTIVISPAPHWRILDQYGGHLNIMKFRESFNNIDYECHGNTKPIPNFLPIGTLFEEKIKF